LLKGTTTKSAIDRETVLRRVNCGGGNHFLLTRSRQAERHKAARTYYRVRKSNGPDWDIPNNDIDSVSHAILERVFFVKNSAGVFVTAPKPWDIEMYPGIEDECKRVKHARQYVTVATSTFCSKMKKIADIIGKASPITDEEFVACYGGAKKRCYQSAVDSLRDTPLEEKDCYVKTFTKAEYRKPGGAPRCIQPRSPRYNVKLGRYIKKLEHTIFTAIDEIFDSSHEHKTVAKGMNMVERGGAIAEMWNSFSDPVAIGVDASRFDQHINRLLLELEQEIIMMWSTGTGLPGDDLPSLKYLLSKQLVNKGRYYGPDGKIKYQVQGARMSGDMNTSLGNVIVMCSLMFSYFEHCGLLNQVKLLNDGDDCVIILERKNKDKFVNNLQGWFRRVGITMEFDGFYNTLEQVEFCQACPVHTHRGWTLVPNPSKRLYSDLISDKPINSKKVFNKWLGAVAGCGLATCSGVPIYDAFYSWIARTADPWLPREGDHYYKYTHRKAIGLEMKSEPVLFSTRMSFYFAYDITPIEQLAIENYYHRLSLVKHDKGSLETLVYLDPMQYLVAPVQKPIPELK
jgi:hypothetical protein